MASGSSFVVRTGEAGLESAEVVEVDVAVFVRVEKLAFDGQLVVVGIVDRTGLAILKAGEVIEVGVAIAMLDTTLSIVVVNGGQMLTDTQTAHLFEPFANADERGRGLGLWVCYQIARQLGGDIAVESELRDGLGRTSFRVTLPVGAHQ